MSDRESLNEAGTASRVFWLSIHADNTVTHSLCICMYTYLATCVEFGPTHLPQLCHYNCIFGYVGYVTL